MLDFFVGVPGRLKVLLDRFTAGRTANLDNLDTTVSSRAPAASALSNGVWTNALAAELDGLSTQMAAVPTQFIKSVQNGITSMGVLSVKDTTIAAVNTAKSFAMMRGFETSTTEAKDVFCAVTLQSSTVVRIERNGIASNVIVSWTVVEFY